MAQAGALARAAAQRAVDGDPRSPRERARRRPSAIAGAAAIAPSRSPTTLDEIDCGEWTGRRFESFTSDPALAALEHERAAARRAPGGRDACSPCKRRMVAAHRALARTVPRRRRRARQPCRRDRGACLYDARPVARRMATRSRSRRPRSRRWSVSDGAQGARPQRSRRLRIRREDRRLRPDRLSSWGNGHATLWRGCPRAPRAAHVVFFERDVALLRAEPRPHRTCRAADLVLYRDWDDVAAPAQRASSRDADVAMVTSYCPDGSRRPASCSAAPRRCASSTISTRP